MTATPGSTDALTPASPAASKVSLRTATVVRYALMGLWLGMLPSVIPIMMHQQPTNRHTLIGGILGGLLGGVVFMTLIGAYRARAIPAEQRSRVGRIAMAFIILPVPLILVGLLVLAVI